MMYKQGDIPLIPFPYSDISATKQRPVLVLSNSNYNSSNQDIVVAAITSNVTNRDYPVPITTNDLIEGQLRVESGVRACPEYRKNPPERSASQSLRQKYFKPPSSDYLNPIFFSSIN